MIDSLLGEFPLFGWRTYLLTCLKYKSTVRNEISKASKIILDKYFDTQYKDLPEIIDIDAIPNNFISYKYKRTRAVFLNHCIEI